ncbi:MAG: GGDEF domain-containing protein [Kiloniellales bacterium]
MIPSFLHADSFPELREEAGPHFENAAERLRQAVLHDGWQVSAAGQRVLLELLDAAAAAEQQIADQQARIRHLESLSVTDELTGQLNRRGFRNELERALARARRHGEAGLLVLCDLDHFKAINDTYGHPAGDAALVAVARLLRERTRRSDAVARMGGDEFAVLMPDGAHAEAEALATKLDSAVNALVITWAGQQIPISASFGWAPYGPDSTAETLIQQADQEAYSAKLARSRPMRIALAG